MTETKVLQLPEPKSKAAGWIVAEGQIIWGLSRKSAAEASADAKREIGFFTRPAKFMLARDVGEDAARSPPQALQVHPATEDLIAFVWKHGGGGVPVWHVGEGVRNRLARWRFRRRGEAIYSCDRWGGPVGRRTRR